MGRRISSLVIGQQLDFYGKRYIVVDVYPYIAYLKGLSTDELLCVNLAELVIAGIEPSGAPALSRGHYK